MVVQIPVTEIHPSVFTQVAKASPEDAQSLETSIRNQGLLHPITVRKLRSGYELISGRHRLEAVKRLGWTTVPAQVVDADDRKGEVMSLEENLRRTTLMGRARSEAITRLHELEVGDPDKKEKHHAISKTAKKAGVSRTKVSRTLKRAEKATPR